MLERHPHNFTYVLVGVVMTIVVAVGCPRRGGSSGLGVAPGQEAHEASGRTYNAEHGFSIVVPQGYRAGKSESPYHFLMLLGPSERGFTVNLTVGSTHDDGSPMEKAGRKASFFQSLVLEEYRLVEEGFTDLGGRRSYFAVCTWSHKGKRVETLTYFLRGDRRRFFAIAFTAPVNTFAKHRTCFEATAKTVLVD